MAAFGPQFTPAKNFWDESTFTSGNGGYVEFRDDKDSGSSGIQMVITSWSMSRRNIVVPITATGQKGMVNYVSVGQTGKVHIEMLWNWKARIEGMFDLMLASTRRFEDYIINFHGYYTDKVNTDNKRLGVKCEIKLTDFYIVSSQKGDSMIKVVMDGVLNSEPKDDE